MTEVRITSAYLVLSASSIAGIVCTPLSLSPLTSLMSQMVELLKAHRKKNANIDHPAPASPASGAAHDSPTTRFLAVGISFLTL